MPVFDKTGLNGNYTFQLHWDQGLEPAALGDAIGYAARKQVGLKLGIQKMPVDVIVVDHAEHPEPN
jgi:uncharacterized protein (TIGR03435 family)